MRAVSISVTEASRNFADCINRARYQGTSFILHKNGVAVARIVPERNPLQEKELEAKSEDLAMAKETGELHDPAKDPSPAEKRREIW
jgi:antitoxin (DNA-binding transcriptional repressor) of toxin-antitoxin stability system